MKILIELDINGEAREVAVESYTTLAELLRDDLGLTGTKEACEVLAPIYDWFSEGHTTADLQDARAVLDELG